MIHYAEEFRSWLWDRPVHQRVTMIGLTIAVIILVNALIQTYGR